MRRQNEDVSGQAGRYQRSPGGMVGALVVLAGVIGVFVALRELKRDDPRSPVRTVDYVQVAEFARKQADFDLVAPESLPAGWRATTVDYVDGEDARWHLGMLTDEENYVGLEQAESSEESMVATYVDQAAVRGGAVDVDGVSWSTWSDEGGDLALLRDDEDTITLVVGNEVPAQELAEDRKSVV